MNALYLIGFVQSIFFTILILSKRKVQLKDFILSVYILILGFDLILIYWQHTGFYGKYNALIILDFAYWTLLGPLLYLYTDISTTKNSRFKLRHLFHILPLAFVLIAFSGYLSSSFSKSFYMYNEDTTMFKLGYLVWFYNSPIYYIILIFKLKVHKKRIKHYYSSTKEVDLKWLNYLVHGFAVFLVFILFNGVISNILNMENSIDRYHYTWLVMVVYIFGIGFYGYKQKGIFSDTEMINDQNNSIHNQFKTASKSTLNTKNQYKKSGLQKEEANVIQRRLEDLMKIRKPYLEYDVTLPKVAELLETTSHKLSQVINEKSNTNFYEYINRHRLSDLKTLLENPENANTKIMALAYDCGFNSKSAFYTFFKKETSLTPTEYRNRYLELVKA